MQIVSHSRMDERPTNGVRSRRTRKTARAIVLTASLSSCLLACSCASSRRGSGPLYSASEIGQMSCTEQRRGLHKVIKRAESCYEDGDIPGYIESLKQAILFYSTPTCVVSLYNCALAYVYLGESNLLVGNRKGYDKCLKQAEAYLRANKGAKGKYNLETELELGKVLVMQNRLSDARELLKGVPKRLERAAYLTARLMGDDNPNDNTIVVSTKKNPKVWKEWSELVGHDSTVGQLGELYKGIQTERCFRQGEYEAALAQVLRPSDEALGSRIGAIVGAPVSAMAFPILVLGSPALLKGENRYISSIKHGRVKAYAPGLDWINTPYHLICPERDMIPCAADSTFMSKLKKRWFAAMAAYKAENYERAQGYFKSVLSREDLLAKHKPTERWLSHYHLGRICSGERKHKQALKHYVEAIEVVERLRDSLPTDELRLGFTEDKNLPYGGAVQSSLALDDVQSAFTYSERARARALLALLASRDSGKAPTADVDKELRSTLEDECLTASQIQAFLGADDSLVEYFVGEDQLVIFVLDGTALKAKTIDVSAQQVQSAVMRFRRDLLTCSGEVSQSGRALHALILEPVEEQIHQNVIVVPHLQLQQVPFSALVDRDGHYLIQTHCVAQVFSGSTLKYAKATGRRFESILALGNPTQRLLPSIPNAERESIAIGRLFSRREVATKDRATEALVKAHGRDYDVLHLACHGQMSPTDPSRTRLLLAPSEHEDGLLSMAEVYESDLAGVSLVTLSACESGRGRLTTGSEVLGLSRAFASAGAPRVVASLWAVNDDATADLMIAFYQELRAGTATADALRQAQLSMLDREGVATVTRGFGGTASTDAPQTYTAPYSHPYFWAAFELIGDWR